MIGIFKNNLFFNSLLLLPYLIVLRIHSLINPIGYTITDSDTILTRTIFGYLESPLAQNILATVLIYIHILYINRLVISHRLANHITLLSGLIYAILMSFLPEYTMLSPYLIANTFILLVIVQIFRTYKKQSVADILFNIGFLIGLASLFISNYILVLLVGLVGLFVLRSIKINEIIQIVTGYVTVFIMYGGILFLLDIPFLPEIWKVSLYPQLKIFGSRGTQLYVILAMVMISVFVVLNYGSYTIKKSIQSQKKIDILYWFLLASGLLFFLSNPIDANQILLFFLPLSIMLNFSFNGIKSILIQEVIHIGLLGLLFAFQFGLL